MPGFCGVQGLRVFVCVFCVLCGVTRCIRRSLCIMRSSDPCPQMRLDAVLERGTSELSAAADEEPGALCFGAGLGW